MIAGHWHTLTNIRVSFFYFFGKESAKNLPVRYLHGAAVGNEYLTPYRDGEGKVASKADLEKCDLLHLTD